MQQMYLRQATENDLKKLSGWFLSKSEVKNWGGASIHFPLILEQLKIGLEWNTAHSLALVGNHYDLIGFAQIFDKFCFKHLGRIIVSPEMRGKKIGYTLMTALLDPDGTTDVNFSLFVYEDNIAAKRLYENIGFKSRAYLKGQQKSKGRIFMIKEVNYD